MLDVLRRRFGIQDAALDWFTSYFADRTQVVVTGTDSSSVCELKTGAPQGSVLGPRSFVMYAEDATDVFQLHGIHHQMFADDMQGLKHGKLNKVAVIAAELGSCASAVNDWCASKRLQLDTGKTAANLKKILPDDQRIQVGLDIIQPSNLVRDLGVYFDRELTMKPHIARITRTCFFHLRRLRAVRRQLGQDITARLVSAFVLSRLDYCTAVLAELPASALAPLQRVLHAAARLVLDLKPRDHVTSALYTLHWLPIKYRITYKLCLLVHLALNGRAPSYIAELLTPTTAVAGRASLRSASHHDLVQTTHKLKFGERAFTVSGPSAWNRLPTEIKTLTDTSLFKQKLKTFLFTVAYPQE